MMRGKTTFAIVNTEKHNNRIYEGVDSEPTGDDAQTIRDLIQLRQEGKLWEEEQDWM